MDCCVYLGRLRLAADHEIGARRASSRARHHLQLTETEVNGPTVDTIICCIPKKLLLEKVSLETSCQEAL